MNKILTISLILSIALSQMTFELKNIGVDLDQYNILIENLPITGFCFLNINLNEQDEDFPIDEADGFQLNFIQGYQGLQTNYLMPGLYSYEYSSCPNKIEIEIGPIKTFHLKANILVKVQFESTTEQNTYTQLVSYIQYSNTNINLITDSQITSQVCNLKITYQPMFYLDEDDQIIVTFPYRDEYAIVPNSGYFKYQTPDCKVEYDGIVNDSIMCYFLQNQLKITKISSQSLLTIIVQGFINSQNLKEITNIQFELKRFITSKYYLLESSVLNYQITQINQEINLIQIQSDDHINSQNILQIQVKYQDFLYIDSIMIITFPNDFFNNQPIITLSENMNLNFISNFVDQTMTLSNFIKNEGKQSIIILSMQIQNPLIQKLYSGLKVKLMWQNQGIAESIPQNILLRPLSFKLFNMDNYNKNLIEQTKYCFTIEFYKNFYQNSYVEIQFFSKISFDSILSITDSQNINSNAQIEMEFQKVKIKNMFINSEFDKEVYFCLNGIYNPSHIDMENESYTFKIMFDNYPQVVNDHKLYINLQHGYLELQSLTQSQELTNQKENSINLSFKTQTGLLENDVIFFYFDVNNYFLDNLLSDNNEIKCEINQQQTFCSLFENSIKIQTCMIHDAESQINIKINNFISNRSLNPINNINIKTFHQIYPIDILPYFPNLSISKPNQLSYFFVEETKNAETTQNSFQIYMQFKIRLKHTDSIIISLPSKINCVNCICQFHDCQINNQKITLTNLYDINQIDQIQILYIQYSDSQTQQSQTQIQVKDQLGYLIFEDQSQIITQINQFKEFNISPVNDFIGIHSNYNLQFISSINFNKNDNVILEFDPDFNINSIQCLENAQCYQNQNQININFSYQIQKNHNISLMIQSIINPNSINSIYYYTLSQYNENHQLIQQSFIKSNYFKCQFENCIVCYSDYCQQCQQGYLKISGKCLYDCPQGYIIINESCKKCETTNYCLTCSSNNLEQCLQCQDGYFLKNNLCIKKDIIQINDTNTTSPNQNNSSQNSTSQNNSNVYTKNKLVDNNNKNQYYLGILNYLEAGCFCALILYKLTNKNFQMFLTSSIILGFSIPIFRVFSLVFFTIEEQYIFSSFTLILLLLSQLQSFHFQAQVEIPLLTDVQYKHNVQKQNYFYLNDLLFKFLDFRIICILKSKLAKSNLFNFSFKYNEEINIALIMNYKRLIILQNPLQITLLLTAIIINNTNNYQFEFLIYSSIEWVANTIIFYQLKKNKF
ncbi:unnamed protein product [Paramecium primaurelia]|uniref:Transmembrane protein n=1 Tax=Paramecium primaurelia TaxID=5886 RepID=A0A8S1JW96_PARPR|nr:unnamed protein product [Paramecium primaurelia]